MLDNRQIDYIVIELIYIFPTSNNHQKLQLLDLFFLFCMAWSFLLNKFVECFSKREGWGYCSIGGQTAARCSGEFILFFKIKNNASYNLSVQIWSIYI